MLYIPLVRKILRSSQSWTGVDSRHVVSAFDWTGHNQEWLAVTLALVTREEHRAVEPIAIDAIDRLLQTKKAVVRSGDRELNLDVAFAANAMPSGWASLLLPFCGKISRPIDRTAAVLDSFARGSMRGPILRTNFTEEHCVVKMYAKGVTGQKTIHIRVPRRLLSPAHQQDAFFKIL